MADQKKTVKELGSPQLKKFCDIYLRNGENAKAAGLEVGYSEAQSKAMATKIKKDPQILLYLAKKKAVMQDAEIVTKEWKLRRLLEIAKSDRKPIEAIAEMNKMQGHYAPAKIEQTNLNIELGRLEALIKINEKDY